MMSMKLRPRVHRRERSWAHDGRLTPICGCGRRKSVMLFSVVMHRWVRKRVPGARQVALFSCENCGIAPDAGRLLSTPDERKRPHWRRIP